jgi:AcrR family transcriptional regulator
MGVSTVSRGKPRAKLLASARDVIAREGYEGATIDRIAEEAGFTKGAFYANFSSKEEIVLELLETHSLADVDEIAALLGDEKDPLKIIDLVSGWTAGRSRDPNWGLLALEMIRRAQRDATFGKRHASLFRAQWRGLGEMLLRLFPEGAAPAEPEALGGLVFELTYGSVSSFKKGPTAAGLVRLALTALYLAHSKRGRRREGD